MLGRPGVVNGWRATSRGPSGLRWMTINSSPSARAQTFCSISALGTEYSAEPIEIVDCSLTLRVSPKQTVCATAGNGCSRARSSASITAGGRRVTRCSRMLTRSQNSWQACSSSAKPA